MDDESVRVALMAVAPFALSFLLFAVLVAFAKHLTQRRQWKSRRDRLSSAAS